MSVRKGISKRVRFNIFKRDGFACQYCGAHPPAVVLEVDHIVSVADGGGNDTDNLVTACFPCNRGKAAIGLEVIPQSLADKAAEVAEREAQLRGYSEVMAAKRERLEDDAWEAFHHWDKERASLDHFNSMKRFVDQLGLHEVLEAIDIARAARTNYGQNAEWRYFCGICWNKIREASER